MTVWMLTKRELKSALERHPLPWSVVENESHPTRADIRDGWKGIVIADCDWVSAEAIAEQARRFKKPVRSTL